ncbi:hypothetical protein POX_a01244 [Penicillium oxalicum]|nr:hypothetical protein POX_a01244 [Penicillium oxalicum]KAI2794645.1 hypothetical protein POX_a01244 [Penicillium oxalicum]
MLAMDSSKAWRKQKLWATLRLAHIFDKFCSLNSIKLEIGSQTKYTGK